MKKKKIFILQGNPVTTGTCAHLSHAYKQGAIDAGHDVRHLNTSELTFDPILHNAYYSIQELEPDLKKVQENFKWADHIVIFYPMWWCSMPALLKGLFDRIWLPGFAYHFHKNGLGWDKLLKKKTGRVIITMGSWPLIARILFGDSTNEIDKGILEFAGIKPTRIKKFGNMEHISPAKKTKLEQKMKRWGSKAK